MSTSAIAIDPRYPIGQFKYEGPYSDEQIARMIQELADLPANLRAAVLGLNEQQLDTPYRDGGWTVRQTVHHVADSHMNSFIRFRLAATEENPAIKPYDEKAWANLADMKLPVEVSLKLIEPLHERLVALLKSYKAGDWKRTMFHAERGKITCEANLAIYSWHSKHHVAQITELRKRKGW
jgi:DinB superfamily